MPKIMLHDEAARAALGRGVAKLAKAVRGTLGPKGMNAIMDRPIGTPIISRDGVSIASEIELECPFENMGAQVQSPGYNRKQTLICRQLRLLKAVQRKIFF